MPTLGELSMIAPGDLEWPLSFRYNIRTSFGWTQNEIHVNVPAMTDKPDLAPALGWELWRGVVAPATCWSSSVDFMQYVVWHQAPVGLPYVGLENRGTRFETSCSRDQCAVLLLHTGDRDDAAGRRLFLPGMPRTWQADGVLTSRGWDACMELAHGVAMGMNVGTIGAECQLLNAYPGIVPPTVENLGGVGFRRIASLRVCQFVDKAPDQSSAIWP